MNARRAAGCVPCGPSRSPPSLLFGALPGLAPRSALRLVLVLEGEDGIFYTDRRNKPIENKALLRLQELPNVLVSPHTAYYTDHALSDTVENSLINCMTFTSGKEHG